MILKLHEALKELKQIIITLHTCRVTPLLKLSQSDKVLPGEPERAILIPPSPIVLLMGTEQ